MALTTSVEAAAGRVPITIVSLDGELDASNFERLVDEMGQLYAAGTRNLLLDLTNLTFLASSGLIALSSIVRIMHGQPPIDPESGWGALHELGNDVADGTTQTAVQLAGPQPAVERVLQRTGLARLGSILAPFDGTGVDGADGSGISLAIEDPDGRVLATAGAPGNRGTANEVGRTIEAGGRAIGRVVGRGTTDRALLEAVVASVAAGLTALAELSNETISRSDAAAATAVRLEAELALGRRIQRSLIPLVPPAIPGYEVASHYEAAREVGGDFFDVFRVRGRAGRFAICIADVTGKGVAAALLMAFTRPLLRAAVDHLRTPAAALEQTNRILVDERRSALFITALCATVELRRGIVRLANAGHEPPLLVPADGGPISWLEGNAPLLGAFARLDLVEQVIQLAPGDLILFYTDGVTDAQAPSGLRFGDDRLIEALESARGGTASDAVEAVCDAYHRFQADQPNADDVAIVALRRAPRRRSVRGGAPR